MSQAYQQELDLAVEAVRSASRLCQEVARHIDRQAIEKNDRSPVTVADFGSQAVICHILARSFAQDPIIAEEDADLLGRPEHRGVLQQVVEYVSGQVGPVDADQVCRWLDRGGQGRPGRRFWTVDPIDGTKGFLRGQQYAVALALIEQGRVVLAVLGCPNLAVEGADRPGALFTAVAGGPTRVQRLFEPGPARPVRVSGTTDPAAARLCESFESGHSRHDQARRIADRLGITCPPLRLDSQCKYAMVADDRADIYLRLPTRGDYVEKIWDHAAGLLLVEQAGGRVTDIEGRALDFTCGRRLEANRGIIVTNGHLHEAVLSAVQQVLAAT